VISAYKVLQIIKSVLTVTRIALSLILTYFFISLTLSFFPETADLAPKLLSHVINPFFMMGEFIVDFIPKLFFIAIILLVTRYALKFIHFIFDQVAVGNIKFKDFHPEWADPTYKLVRILIIALCFVVVFPYLPGSDSPAFKGVTVFLGVLFSLGSSPAIGNIVAGIIITYMRPFKVGDRVRISDTEGDIIEKNLLVTRIRTERNEDITVPNSMVLGSHITNYNTSARDGLALYAVVTLGYEVPWQEAHALMIKAAEKTKGVVSKPAPYVLHKFLHDFYVIYEIYAYTDNPNLKYLTHSELNKNVQDVFNEAGIELVSPHLAGLRDSNHTSLHSGKMEKFERNNNFIINSENKKS
jgi:small-conductance mechanosensitive channel